MNNSGATQQRFLARYAPAFMMASAAGLFFSGTFWHAAHSPMFGLGTSGTTILGAVTTFGSAVLSLPMGHFSDKIGRRPLRLIGCLLFAFVSLLTSQAYEVWHLYVLMIFASAGMSMFWPATQADLYDSLSVSERRQTLSRYNCVWSAAVTIMPFMGGIMYGAWPFSVFAASGALAVITLVIVSVIRLPRHAEHSEPEVPENRAKEHRTLYFLRIAYIANCVVWGGRAALGFMLPALNEKLGRTSFDNGLASAILNILLIGGFFIFVFTSRWQYKLRVIFGGQALVIAGIIASSAFKENFPVFLVCIAITGLGAAVTYASAQFYSLDTRRNAGRRIGLHETLLNVGSITIPGIAGMAAGYFKIDDWAFYVAGMMIFAGMVAQFVVAKMTSPNLPGSLAPRITDSTGVKEEPAQKQPAAV